MDIEETLKLVDTAVFVKTDRHLSDPEVTILRGACLGMTYEQMAEGSQYKLNYLMRDIGPKFWKLLSEVLGEEVSKANLRAALGRQWRSPSLPAPPQVQLQSGPASDSAIVSGESPIALEGPRVDWGEAPDVPIFCGRTQQLQDIKKWIVTEHCRLVVLSGVGGIGKTTLSVKLAQQLQGEFECVIWRSLRQAPTLAHLLTDLMQCFKRSPQINLPVDVDERISQLIANLHSSKCLIVLDGFETILEPTKLAGHYREGFEKYGELIQRMAEQQHKSCVVIVTREMPEAIELLVGDPSPVRALKLTGLQETEARYIFQAQNLLNEDKWTELINIYQGNPLELKIVAPAIRELFSGQVSEFIKRQTFVFGGIKALLNDQFQRLEDLEKAILYWLAIEGSPVSLEQLADCLLFPVSKSEILEALSSLLRRELIDKNACSGQTEFMLHQVLMQYVTEQLTSQICTEIFEILKKPKLDENKIKLLTSHLVLKNPQLVPTKKIAMEQNSIAITVKNHLTKLFKSNSKGYDQLNKVYSLLKNQPLLERGYIQDNFQNLLAVMQVDEKNLTQGDRKKQHKSLVT
ncbi:MULTISPECIES: NB-ARC domain-containing protein [unclassified Microcoleus]|uniref:NB-ARC domain-containing protein n=1 Tax=unclassified Microcoleus TaxID=2642155 RepID=UPI002FCF6654